MGPIKPREERKPVFVRARLRTERGWSDVTIGNVSSRGLMLQSITPLRRSEFVEVRSQNVCIVGRIAWVGGTRCGVRTQDQVDIGELLAPGPAKRPDSGDERRAAGRKLDRPQRAAAPAETAEASRRIARALEWTVVAIGGGAAAAFVAQAAFSALDAPLARVGAALAGG